MPSTSGWKLSATVTVTLTVTLLISSACKEEPAELVVELADAATASPQYFHGDCFAGWSVQAGLRARDTSRVGVVLDSLTYRIVDEGSSRELAAEILDRAAIDSRYGAMATVIPGGSSRHFTVSGIAPERPLGPLRVTGTMSGRDDNGKPVSATFALGGPITFDDVPPPSGGACTPP